MAVTYLALANKVVSRINETQLVATTGQRGVHLFILNSVNDVIRMVNEAEPEWPFNVSPQTISVAAGKDEHSITQDTVDWDSFFLDVPENVTNGEFTSDISGWTSASTGTGAITFSAGRLALNGGAAGNAIARQTISVFYPVRYRVKIKAHGADLKIRMGTTSGDSDILSDVILVNPVDSRLAFFDFHVNSTTSNIFIQISNDDNAEYYVDYISVKEAQSAKKLTHLPFDEYQMYRREDEVNRLVTSLDKPDFVVQSQNNKFILVPTPKQDYVVKYDAWVYPAADLSATTDVMNIPDKYMQVVIDGCMWLLYLFKEDFEQAGMLKTRFDKGIDKMRTQLINRPDRMRAEPTYFPGWRSGNSTRTFR